MPTPWRRNPTVLLRAISRRVNMEFALHAFCNRGHNPPLYLLRVFPNSGLDGSFTAAIGAVPLPQCTRQKGPRFAHCARSSDTTKAPPLSSLRLRRQIFGRTSMDAPYCAGQFQAEREVPPVPGAEVAIPQNRFRRKHAARMAEDAVRAASEFFTKFLSQSPEYYSGEFPSNLWCIDQHYVTMSPQSHHTLRRFQRR